ncbi:MAG TPA: response regulator [Ktedonobacteraceae bacterium]|nr:response regulator [Ktedonobacteraceae bacterium]
MTPTLTCSSSATVLMIDDNPEDLEYWSKLLRVSSSNYSILKAQRVRAGLDLCQYQKIDCIIVDLDMGDSSGFEVLLTLIPDRKRPEIAVVVLTRLRNPSLHETVLYHGAQAYLVKQLTSADELDKAIQKAVTSVASKLNERPPKDCG